MKRFSDGARQPAAGAAAGASGLALSALTWLVSNEDLFPVFLGATGADPAALAAALRSGAAGRPADLELLASVLDFLLMDDAWIAAFCDAEGLRHEAPLRARAALPGANEAW